METGCNEPEIATPDEVLEKFTQLMRSEKASEQFRAAEQLAKYHNLFTPKECTGFRPELIEEIERTVQEIAGCPESGQIAASAQACSHDRMEDSARTATGQEVSHGAKDSS